jgi:hypothetical protein
MRHVIARIERPQRCRLPGIAANVLVLSLLASCATRGVHRLGPAAPAGLPSSLAPTASASPPAISAPTVTLLDAGHGVELASVSAAGGGDQGTAPSTLWLSTDTLHWRDVTPSAARQPVAPNLYPIFDSASFLSATSGWVADWNVGNLGVTIYGTSDGGRTWRVLSGAGHGDHAGDAYRIQLVTPSTAFAETVAAAAPNMSLAVTTDAAKTWRTVYTGPPVHADSEPAAGPFELPMRFTSPTRGFAATAIPPAETQVEDGFFSTADGGADWTRLALPSLATELITGADAEVGFDTSADAGASWQVAATVRIQLPAVATNAYPKPYALVSTPGARTWWIASSSDREVTTRVTDDAGQHWSDVQSASPSGEPVSLAAIDTDHALLGTSITTSNGTTGALYVTSDGGHGWQRLFAEASTPDQDEAATPGN